MKSFNLINDLFQFFTNEYISPGNKVLILNYYTNDLKNILSFINCDFFFVNEISLPGFDIISDYNSLPFEEWSFDIIINFNKFETKYNLLTFLKPGGVLLTKDEILNGLNYYYFNETFTVI